MSRPRSAVRPCPACSGSSSPHCWSGCCSDAHGGSDGQSTLDAIVKICVQLLLPFVAGQLLRPVIGHWVDRHKGKLKFVDQGSILLVVYTAFSAAVIEGLWRETPILSLVGWCSSAPPC